MDFFGRSTDKKTSPVMNSSDFYAIDDLLQDFIIIENNLGSIEFRKRFENKLKEICDQSLSTDLLITELRNINNKKW